MKHNLHTVTYFTSFIILAYKSCYLEVGKFLFSQQIRGYKQSFILHFMVHNHSQQSDQCLQNI